MMHQWIWGYAIFKQTQMLFILKMKFSLNIPIIPVGSAILFGLMIACDSLGRSVPK